MTKKILITGSNGLLGSDLFQYISSCPGYEAIPTTRNNMDITDFNKIHQVFNHTIPNAVIHTAAETNVDLCEEDPDHAFLINTIGTKYITIACAQLNIPIIFISTCGLFNGKKEDPYTEYDQPDPLTAYARSKYEAEKIIQSIWHRHFIIRIGWLFGGRFDHKKNFITNRWNESRKKTEMVSAIDKYGSPTYSMDVAKKIIELVESGIYGTYHVANNGKCSRYDYVLKIFEILGSDIKIKPVDSSHFPRSAPVPNSESIQNYNLRLMDMDDLKTWDKALEEYISCRFIKEKIENINNVNS